MKNDEMLRYDYIHNHEDLKVCQHKKMFHINTDTILLGEFIKINEDESVLDVGTNNGALLLYCALKKAKKITGIDINAEAIFIAKKTLEINNIDATLIAGDFKTYQSRELYDVIISNPPYFNTCSESNKNKNEYLLMARHEDYLPLLDLLKGIKRNINHNGRIYLVHRPNRLNEIKQIAESLNIYVHTICYVYAKNKREAKTILIELYNEKKVENITTLVPIILPY